MCVLSIKVPIRKTSGNLFNDPRTSVIYFLSRPTFSRKLNISHPQIIGDIQSYTQVKKKKSRKYL